MIKNLKDGPEEFKDYDSELLLKIINKTSVEIKKSDDKELFVDENWKINSKNIENEISSDNSNLKKINKKYYEIMRQADNAVGRKEVVSLLKKAATIMSKSEENLAA